MSGIQETLNNQKYVQNAKARTGIKNTQKKDSPKEYIHWNNWVMLHGWEWCK